MENGSSENDHHFLNRCESSGCCLFSDVIYEKYWWWKQNNPQIEDTIPLWGTGVQDETAGCIFK